MSDEITTGLCYECGKLISEIEMVASPDGDELELCPHCGEVPTKVCGTCSEMMPLGDHLMNCEGCSKALAENAARARARDEHEGRGDYMRDRAKDGER